MAPEDKSPADKAWVLEETDAVTEDKAGSTLVPPSATEREIKIVWKMVAVLSSAHIGGMYGGYLFFTQALWSTRVFLVIYYVMTALGVTVAVHRYWTHKAFKARLPLKILLIILNSMAFQGHVFTWARDHRMHHKYSETDADPYNSTRGLFFSHIGWLLVRKHPQVMAKGHTIHLDDLLTDPVVQFQKKYYAPMMIFFSYILPTWVPTLWGESKWTAFFVVGVLRFILILHASGLINSVAHKWGDRPYDKHISPVEVKPLSIFALGEGFHNFHHTFPWDYKAEELGGYSLNLSTLFIDAMAKIGMAYDLKSVSRDIVEKRVKRTGDGTHPVWGWDDAAAKDKMAAVIDNPHKTE